MKINVYHSGSTRENIFYTVEPAFEEDISSEKFSEQFNALLPRIEAMAKKQLDEDFRALHENKTTSATLVTRTGTTERQKHTLADLLSWIRVFSEE